MSSDDQRTHLEKLLKTYTRNKNLLENQAASFGGEDTAPLHVVNQLEAVRDKIKELQGQLDFLGGSSTSSGTTTSASTPSSSGSVVNFGSGNNQSGATINIGDVAGRDIIKNETVGGTTQQSSPPTAQNTNTPPPAPNQVLMLFETNKKGTTIRWESPLMGRARTTTFTPPYDDQTLSLIVKALDAAQYPQHPVTGPQFTGDEQSELAKLQIWESGRVSPDVHKIVGQAIYRALGDEGRKNLEEIRNYSIRRRERISYVLRFPQEAILTAALPWEVLWDFNNQPILLSQGDQIDSCERYIDIARAIPTSLPRGDIPHILALSPAYNINEQIRSEERQRRLEIWNQLRDDGKITFDELGSSDSPAVTIRSINDYLRRRERNRLRKPDIIHYFGHGIYRDNQGFLLFDDGRGGKDRVNASRLASIFGNVRLVVILACESAHIEEEGGLLTGVGPALSIVTDAVVAMQLTTRIDAATRFAEIFYDELLNANVSLQDAVAEGRQILYSEEPDGASWYVPTIYIRSEKQEPFFLVQ